MPLHAALKIKMPDATKEVEIHLAISMACHCAIRTIDDHAGEILTSACKCHLQKIHLHRTKYFKIITNVVSASLRKESMADLEGQKYSIKEDELTDCASEKNLCILDGYYSEKSGDVETAFLSLVPVTEITGEALFVAVKGRVDEFRMEWKDCIGYASDGAANMLHVEIIY